MPSTSSSSYLRHGYLGEAAHYGAGASHGGSRFLNYVPDVWGRMGTQRGEEETMPSLPVLYLSLLFVTSTQALCKMALESLDLVFGQTKAATREPQFYLKY